MAYSTSPCSVSGCPNLVRGSGRCDSCRSRLASHRPTAEQRGYGRKWRLNRSRYLTANPQCAICGEPAAVPDHWPVSRNMLIAQGDPHPDAWSHLRPLCASDHGRETAINQPGGWAARG